MKHPRNTPVEVLPAVIEPEALSLSPRFSKKLEAAPVTVLGTWDSARRWLAHGKYLQEAALYCQVMLGFELLALRENHPETRGGPPGKQKYVGRTFADQAMEETCLGRDSVFKLMRMAEAAIPRLRKISGLRDFDPSSQTLLALPDAQRTALSAAVHKITDGLTQGDFLVELGLAKSPQGSGATGGARTRLEPLSSSQKAEWERKCAVENFAAAMRTMEANPIRFTLLEDIEITTQIAELEHYIKIRRRWLSMPKGQRDVTVIEALLKAH